MRIDRRQIFGLLGAAAAAAGSAQAAAAPAFRHGVASGDPLADRLIIWTRLSVDDQAPHQVTWQVATDAAFARIARQGRAMAEAARDHTVKIDVDGLKPGVDYFYRFQAAGVASPTGRARTLPAGPTPDAVLAVVSCQLYPGGLFNAYEVMAKLDRLDAVVHLGDYIYEYGAEPGAYGMSMATAAQRVPDPPHEILTLADYRRRHAQYKSDPDLQAAHARAPFICVWDDHEVANDAWTDGAENHQPATEGDWTQRRATAIRAYYEWMPIREPAAGAGVMAIQRRFDFGDLASLFMVETRLASRSQQLSYAELPTKAGPDGKPVPDVAAFEARRNAPGRELLGEAQRRWLADGMAQSHAAGRPWQIIGNQVVMAQVAGPDAIAMIGPEKTAQLIAGLPEAIQPGVKASIGLFQLGLPYNLDAWDGYPAARERLYQAFKASGARPVVLSGDSHAFWVNQLANKAGETVAVELGTSSISSPSNGDSLPGFPLGEALAARNEEVLLCDQSAKGFILMTLGRTETRADLHAVTIAAKPYSHSVVRSYRIPADPKIGHLLEG